MTRTHWRELLLRPFHDREETPRDPRDQPRLGGFTVSESKLYSRCASTPKQEICTRTWYICVVLVREVVPEYEKGSEPNLSRLETST